MSAPTIDDFPALGFVPCPGDHAAVDKDSDSIRHTVVALGEIKKVLDGAAKGDWRGKAAIAFRELLDDDFRPKVVDAYDSPRQGQGRHPGLVRLHGGQAEEGPKPGAVGGRSQER
ncbi:hypothetical protein [Streptomyces sp. NPDC058985]|uniref:hypothetical protein n=1 Tax=Streptomyces sp. NPDC058985 TaxID=3346684 RepID=UPI003684F7C2